MQPRRHFPSALNLFVTLLSITIAGVIALTHFAFQSITVPRFPGPVDSREAPVNAGNAILRNRSIVTNNRSKEAGGTKAFTAESAVGHPWCSGKINHNVTSKSSTTTLARQTRQTGTYFLTAVLLVRIFAYDINKLTSSELAQWLQYMSYAGVEHVYVYDGYVYKNESQREALSCFVQNGFVTYVDWHHKAVDMKNRDQLTQIPAYQDCLDRFRHQFTWQTAIDIDEYPFCPSDRAPGFLARFVQGVIESRNLSENIGQIFMQNFLFLGAPPNVTAYPLLIDRFWNRTRNKWNKNRKPIFLSKAVRRPSVHSFALNGSYAEYHPTDDFIRINHYHGARHSRSETVRVSEIDTTEDRNMSTASSALELCRTGCAMGCCE